MKYLFLVCLSLSLVAFAPRGAIAAEAEQPALRLTLGDALSLALAENPAIALARNRQQSASVDVSTAQASFLPDLQASSSASQRYVQQAPPGQAHESQSLNVGLSSSINLFNGFADEAGLNSARRQLDASAALLLRQQQTTAFNVATTYIDVLSNRELVKVAEQSLALEEAFLAQIDAFYQAGNRSITDLYQQQAAKAQAELALLDARRNLEVSLLLLVQSLGQQPPLALDPQLLNPLALVDSLKALTPETALARALQLRPDLLAQSKQVEAARETLSQVRAGHLPRLDLVGSADTGYSSLNSSSDFGGQLGRENGVATLSLNLSIPLFDRNQTRNGTAQARIAEDDAALQVAQLRQQIGVEVGQALADYRRANLQLSVTRSQLDFSRQALDAAKARYQAGAASWVDRATAVTTFVRAQGDEVRARYTLLQQGLTIGYARGDLENLLARLNPSKELP